LRYAYPILILLLSIAFIATEDVSNLDVDINYFGLAAYGSISIIMLLALFIVQRIINIKEVYYYLLTGFTFVYVSLFISTMDKLYVYPADVTDILEDLFRLVGSAFVVIAIIKWIKYNEEINSQLIELASLDDLTGIMNRRVFDLGLKREYANAKRYQKELSIIAMDIDNFKEINDQYGHFFGDLVLKMFTKEVSSLLREGDLFGRWGGDEFTVLLPQTGAEAAVRVAEKIRLAVKNISVKTDDETITCSVSLGVSSFINDDEDVLELVERADKALYEAKATGRDRSVLHDQKL
jgi:diguanylate cyclase (GGDEF)-like protein